MKPTASRQAIRWRSTSSSNRNAFESENLTLQSRSGGKKLDPPQANVITVHQRKPNESAKEGGCDSVQKHGSGKNIRIFGRRGAAETIRKKLGKQELAKFRGLCACERRKEDRP